MKGSDNDAKILEALLASAGEELFCETVEALEWGGDDGARLFGSVFKLAACGRLGARGFERLSAASEKAGFNLERRLREWSEPPHPIEGLLKEPGLGKLSALLGACEDPARILVDAGRAPFSALANFVSDRSSEDQEKADRIAELSKIKADCAYGHRLPVLVWGLWPSRGSSEILAALAAGQTRCALALMAAGAEPDLEAARRVAGTEALAEKFGSEECARLSSGIRMKGAMAADAALTALAGARGPEGRRFAWTMALAVSEPWSPKLAAGAIEYLSKWGDAKVLGKAARIAADGLAGASERGKASWRSALAAGIGKALSSPVDVGSILEEKLPEMFEAPGWKEVCEAALIAPCSRLAVAQDGAWRANKGAEAAEEIRIEIRSGAEALGRLAQRGAASGRLKSAEEAVALAAERLEAWEFEGAEDLASEIAACFEKGAIGQVSAEPPQEAQARRVRL